MADGRHELAALESPVARDLLASAVPARLAYAGRGGVPRVLPTWFHWDGRALVMACREASPRVAAIRRRPAVAITIDTEAPPYRMLQLRGRAEIDVVDGIAPEYALAAHRYYGREVGERWLARMRTATARMARIVVVPDWARVFDVGAVFPESRR